MTPSNLKGTSKKIQYIATPHGVRSMRSIRAGGPSTSHVSEGQQLEQKTKARNRKNMSCRILTIESEAVDYGKATPSGKKQTGTKQPVGACVRCA